MGVSTIICCVVVMLLQSAILVGAQCPMDCICDYVIHDVGCYDMSNMSWPQFYLNLPANTETLHIHSGIIDVIPSPPRDLPPFTKLRQLTIEDCGVEAIQPGAFAAAPMLTKLHLVHNNISSINSTHFKGLDKLEVLDLSHNGLKNIHEKTFKNWTHLEVLDMSHNELDTIPILAQLPSLRKLDLSNSHVRYVHPNTLNGLDSLEVLDLRQNNLDTLHLATFTNVTIEEIYLSQNPWDCHCGITWLIEQLQSSDSYQHKNDIVCHAPTKYLHQKVVDLNPEELYCDAPSIFSTSTNQSVQYMHSTLLDCNVSAPASVYWLTPRGVLVHPDHQRWLPPSVTEFSQRLAFDGKPSYWEASIEALENGTLLVDNFRNFFAGEYTCVAENPEGVAMVSLILEIYSIMNAVMEVSTLLGYSMAMGCLVAGIIIGATRMCAERHCKCCKPPQKPPSVEGAKDGTLDSQKTEPPPEDDFTSSKHWTDIGTYQYSYDPTMRSPSLSPRMSPMKCVTPAEYAEDFEDEDALPPPHLTDDIKELLVMVRASLRHGIDASSEHVRTAMHDSETVEHMRERAQNLRESLRTTGSNLRESSALTLQRFRSTSSQYASRARTGVAVGLDQVKSHVQSMKEMCGTGGDLASAGHTVSVVSMETDVDNQESKEVVKTVTML